MAATARWKIVQRIHGRRGLLISYDFDRGFAHTSASIGILGRIGRNSFTPLDVGADFVIDDNHGGLGGYKNGQNKNHCNNWLQVCHYNTSIVIHLLVVLNFLRREWMSLLEESTLPLANRLSH